MTSLSDNDTQKVCITRLRYRGNDKSQTMIHRGYVLPDSVIEEMTSLSDNDTQRVCITRQIVCLFDGV